MCLARWEVVWVCREVRVGIGGSIALTGSRDWGLGGPNKNGVFTQRSEDNNEEQKNASTGSLERWKIHGRSRSRGGAGKSSFGPSICG